MALDKPTLQDALRDLFEGKPAFPASKADAAADLAAIYRAYAAGAAAATTTPVIVALTARAATLTSALETAFTVAEDAGPPGVVALGIAMDTALVAFWTAMPFAFAGPPVIGGVVSLAPPLVLGPALTALFLAGAAGGPTAAQQAQGLATILDAWTRTVTVVNTPITPPGPATPPIPLT